MNIISFSLWGNLPIYNVGAIENAKLKMFIYPNWICRYYVDRTVPQQTIDELRKLNAEIIMMDEEEGFKRLFWRFYPAEDKNINKFIVRDCDSRINIKEALAVKEWIESKKQFHIMRDNRCHTLPMQGGMWGGVGGILKNIKEASTTFINENNNAGYKNFYNLDQMFLNNKIWPKIINLHLAHSLIKLLGNEKDFPIQLENGMFIGQVFDENNNSMDDSRRNPLI
jgi:hypothetical protein